MTYEIGDKAKIITDECKCGGKECSVGYIFTILDINKTGVKGEDDIFYEFKNIEKVNEKIPKWEGLI